MLQILRQFNWTWFGLLVIDEDYGRHAARLFQSDLAQSGGSCLAYLEVLPQGNDMAEIQRIVGIMKKSTSRVVIVFAHPSNMLDLMEEVSYFGIIGICDVSFCMFNKGSKIITDIQSVKNKCFGKCIIQMNTDEYNLLIKTTGCKAECNRPTVDGE